MTQFRSGALGVSGADDKGCSRSVYSRVGLRLGRLVDPYVVDPHGGGKNGGLIRIARPETAYGKIEQQIERVIEGPVFGGWKAVGVLSLEELAVHIKANDVWFPLDGEKMKSIAEAGVVGQSIPTGERVAA